MKYVSPEYQKQLEDLAETLVIGHYATHQTVEVVPLPETARIYDFPVATPPPPPEAA